MRLAGRTVTFFLGEDGKEFFHRITGEEHSPDLVTADVEETDDVGIWIRMQRRKSPASLVLLRWEFILGIELPVDTGKVVGLKG
jgi:hypothetical protein